MNEFNQTNGRNGTLTDDLTPGHTLNLEFPSAYPVGPLTTLRPRASLAALDAFRTLALTIETVVGDLPISSIALLSAVPGEGRSFAAEMLSLAMSETCPPVRLIDADPFQHAVTEAPHRRLRLGRRPPDPVVAEGENVNGSGEPGSGEVPTFKRLPIARDAYSGPSTFLDDVQGAIDMAVGIDLRPGTLHGAHCALRARVLVDAPACSLSSIGFSIAQMVDAVIYVVRPDRAPLERHREVLAQLTLLKVNVLGTLLNEG